MKQKCVLSIGTYSLIIECTKHLVRSAIFKKDGGWGPATLGLLKITLAISYLLTSLMRWFVLKY